MSYFHDDPTIKKMAHELIAQIQHNVRKQGPFPRHTWCWSALNAVFTPRSISIVGLSYNVYTCYIFIDYSLIQSKRIMLRLAELKDPYINSVIGIHLRRANKDHRYWQNWNNTHWIRMAIERASMYILLKFAIELMSAQSSPDHTTLKYGPNELEKIMPLFDTGFHNRYGTPLIGVMLTDVV